jgi:flagellar motility protein MotE (MotC chaperone)
VLDPRPSRTRLALLGLVAGLVAMRLVAGQLGGDDPGEGVTGDPVGNVFAQAQSEPESSGGGGMEQPAAGPRFTEEEVRVLTELRQRRDDLQARRERLSKTEERLRILRDKVGEDLDRLERFRDQVQVGLNKEKQLRTEKMDHLVKVYSNMNPEKAAERIDRMDAKTAVKLLSRMSGESAGRILSFVDPDKANRISQDMTRMIDEVE